VTYQLRRCDSATHCNGINRLRSTADGCYLFSASRDSTVKRWEVAQSEGGGSPKFEASFEHHVDWVNDLVLLGDTLVSCSSDKTVNLWQASSPGDCLVSFQQHADYVTCLAAATQRGWVASGGLRGEIFLWDLAAASAVGKAGNNSRPCEMNAQGEDSTYALAFTPSGQVLASGSTNKSVMIWDPRQEGPVMWLKGHQGNIRALAINADGHSLLSAGSDGKIRLWDLGQQRCSQVRAGFKGRRGGAMEGVSG
jgi:WD repeat-containing protein 48